MSQSWYPGEYRPDLEYPPHYSTMPDHLRVEDAVRPTLHGRRRRFWTRSRDAGLHEWDPVGFRFAITTTAEPYKPNRVSLAFSEDVPPTIPAWHCFEACGPCIGIEGCDWIQFRRDKLEQFFLARNQKQMTYLVAHEFGHSLGFGHGGDGIMDETPEHATVNLEEIAAARAFWGIA